MTTTVSAETANPANEATAHGVNRVEHEELLDQLDDAKTSGVKLLEQLADERNRILSLIDDISQHQRRFRCYLCQEYVVLSMLVLNDRCRHSICRVCFSKVTMNSMTTAATYACLACDSAATSSPTMLAILSPGIEENSNDIGYLVHLIDNS